MLLRDPPSPRCGRVSRWRVARAAIIACRAGRERPRARASCPRARARAFASPRCVLSGGTRLWTRVAPPRALPKAPLLLLPLRRATASPTDDAVGSLDASGYGVSLRADKPREYTDSRSHAPRDVVPPPSRRSIDARPRRGTTTSKSSTRRRYRGGGPIGSSRGRSRSRARMISTAPGHRDGRSPSPNRRVEEEAFLAAAARRSLRRRGRRGGRRATWRQSPKRRCVPRSNRSAGRCRTTVRGQASESGSLTWRATPPFSNGPPRAGMMDVATFQMEWAMRYAIVTAAMPNTRCN